MNNIKLQTTIVHPLYDLQIKGGYEDAYRPTVFDRELKMIGKRMLDNSELLEKDMSTDQTLMDINTYVPAGGFQPVTLVHRG